MSRGRLLVVHLLIAVIGFGSLSCIATGREAWPFLTYPMYAELAHGRRELVWLYGVNGGDEVPLLDWGYWQPLGVQRVGIALELLEARPDGRRLVTRALEHLARRYELLRERGRHAGPSIEALRAYDLAWNVHADLANFETPEHRRLMGEVRLDARR